MALIAPRSAAVARRMGGGSTGFESLSDRLLRHPERSEGPIVPFAFDVRSFGVPQDDNTVPRDDDEAPDPFHPTDAGAGNPSRVNLPFSLNFTPSISR